MSSLERSGLMESDALDKQIATGADVGPTEKSLQEKFVAYVQGLTCSTDDRSSVWMEHSYARARRGGGAAPRSLLVRRGPACPDCHLEDDVPIDVDTIDEPLSPPLPPEPLRDDERLNDLRTDEPEDMANWEEELDALAPTATHRRLAANVLELIRSLRTARLAGAPRSARAHARRLRRELAPLWGHAGPLQQRPAAWMHGALSGYLPRPYLDIYNDMVSELARDVPRLVERLLAGQVAPAPAEPEATGPRVPSAADRPLLVWLPSGREKRDDLWERRLCHLLPVHRIKAPVVTACSPEAWCTAVAVSARSALTALTGVPRSSLALGGWGAGAALAVHLASTWDAAAGPAPKCLALLAPPLLTAEGPRDSLDDPLLDVKAPVLFVVGQNAMQCTVGIAEEVRSRLGTWSRLVVVGGADDALRLTHQKLRMERVTQQMVDAALAEEVRGFVAQATRDDADGCRDDSAEWSPDAESAGPPSPPRRRRAATPPPPPAAPAKRRYGAESPPPAASPASAASPAPAAAPPAAPSAGKGRGLALLRVSSAPLEPSHTHLAGRGGGRALVTDWEEVLAATETYHKPTRNIRITDSSTTHGMVINGGGSKGYSVVARGTGSVPLCLPPPRRSTPAPAPAAPLAPADIMQLPIVFADDDKHLGVDPPATPPTPSSSASQITSSISVRSGAPLKYTKVILAKRMGVASPGGAASTVATSAGATVTVSVSTPGVVTSSAGARPIIVKGGLRIMPKTLVIKRNTSSPALSPSKKSPSEDQSPV